MVTSKNIPAKDPEPGEQPFDEDEPLAETQPFDLQPPSYTSPPSYSSQRGATSTTTSYLRRHAVAVGITAATLAVVLISGLTAWGVGTAVAEARDTTAFVASSQRTPSLPAPGKRSVRAARPVTVRGTIQRIAGSTWTISTHTGAKQRVTVEPTTLFGTKKAPASAADFAVGTAVLVVEKPGNAGTIAVRIVAARAGAHAPRSTATPNV